MTKRSRSLAKKVYRGIGTCGVLETCARYLVGCLEDKRDSRAAISLVKKCLKRSWKDRQAADAAMHELGIGYYQIYE